MMSALPPSAHPPSAHPPLLCPTCLQLCPAPVTLPCGHAFCLRCLRTMDQGLDRHCCPQCRQEYHPKDYGHGDGDGDCSDAEIVAGNDSFLNKSTGEMKAGGFEGKGSSVSVDSELYDYLKSKMVEPKAELASNVTEDGLESPLLLVLKAEEDERKMSESKLKLTSEVSDLTDKLEKAEMLLKKEQEYELNVTTANAKQRANALKLVGEVTSLAQSYSETIMARIQQEFSPGEETIRKRVEEASQFRDQIKNTRQEVDNLLKEENAKVFTSKLQSLASEMERCKEVKPPEGSRDVNFDLSKLCPELERLGRGFRDTFGQVQRSLRSEFNPSEATFDPETLHPNLLLSEDLKTVKFSSKKQPYDPTPQRFTSFMQVLSAQSFSAGVHRWEVELDGAPWILGVCVASSLPRSGLPSALEACPWSWALMWNQNLLTAFERSKATPLKKTSQVSRRMEMKLDCDRGQLDFHNLSQTGQKSLIHRFNTEREEPLHLVYRMLSGDPRGRLTLCPE